MSDTPETDLYIKACWGDGFAAKHLEKPMQRLESERNEALQLARELRLHLEQVIEQYDDRKAQWGGDYLWGKHEDAEVIAKAKEALA